MMTPRELAIKLKWPTDRKSIRKLIRRIKAKERVLGQQIFIRLSGGRLQTTDALLRHHMPELVQTRDEMQEMIKEELDHIQEQIATLNVRDRALAARIKIVLDRVKALEIKSHNGP